MTAPTNPDAETTPSRAVVVSDACSRFRPTPETTAAWYAALDWCRLRGEGHDPHHAALANLAEKLERERDAARESLTELYGALVRYEADVDSEAPSEHCRMMARAREILNSENRGGVSRHDER